MTVFPPVLIRTPIEIAVSAEWAFSEGVPEQSNGALFTRPGGQPGASRQSSQGLHRGVTTGYGPAS